MIPFLTSNILTHFPLPSTPLQKTNGLKPIVALSLFVVCIACGPPALLTLPSLIARQPRVIAVEPQDGVTVESAVSVAVTFSTPIEPTTITKNSFIVVEGFETMTPQDVKQAIEDEEMIGIDGQYDIADDGKKVAFTPANNLKLDTTYGIIITTAVTTPDYIPFNQTPAGEPTPFVSTFKTAGTGDEAAAGLDEANELNEGDDVTPLQNGATDGSSAQTSQPPTSPVKLIINEIYYDAPGSDTNGDLFIELRGAPAGGEIAGYKIIFVNGDDGKITESETLPGGAVIPETGLYVVVDAVTGDPNTTHVTVSDYITNFDPQNGPDAVQLIDDHGKLADALCYGEVTVETAENGLTMCEGVPAPDAPGGKSLSRPADAEDTDDNAADFVIGSPSPGEDTIAE